MFAYLFLTLLLAAMAQASWEESLPDYMDPSIPNNAMTNDPLEPESYMFDSDFLGWYVTGKPENTPGALVPRFFFGIFEEDTIIVKINFAVGEKLSPGSMVMEGVRVRDGQVSLAVAPRAGQLLLINAAVGQVAHSDKMVFLMKLDAAKNEVETKLEGNRRGEERIVRQRLDGKWW